MLLSLSKPKQTDLFYPLLFLFFFTLHADRLCITVGDYTCRFNNLLALFLLITIAVRFRAKLFCFDRKIVLGLLLILSSVTLSFLFSPYKTRCFFFFGWFLFTLLCYFVLPYLLITLLDTRRVLKYYFLSFFCVGTYATLQLLLSFVGFMDPFCGELIREDIVRPNAFCYEPSYYALYMTPFVVMANLHYLLRKKEDFILFSALKLKHVLLINFFYFVSTSTSAYIAYIAFLLSALLISPLKVKKRVLQASALLIVLSIVATLIIPNIMRIFFLKFFTLNFAAHYSFAERWYQIHNAWVIFLKHPLMGVGLGGAPVYLYDSCMLNNQDFIYNSSQLMTVSTGTASVKCFEPSNMFTEILASLGIIGAFAFLFLLIIYFRAAMRMIVSKSLNAIQKHWALLFLCSILLILFVVQFSQGICRTFVWTHFAFACACQLRSSNSESLFAKLSTE